MQNHAMLAELGIIALFTIPLIVLFATDKRRRKRRRLLEQDRCSDDEARPAPSMQRQQAILEAFMDRYALTGLPEGMEWYVRDLDGRNMYNYYELEFPEWKYATSTGARDSRRKKNELVRYDSVLFADYLIFTTQSPMTMIQFVNELRRRGCPIRMNELEKKKYGAPVGLTIDDVVTCYPPDVDVGEW